MKMLSSLHAYNKAKKVNCLINSWNIEGFKVFALHQFKNQRFLTSSIFDSPIGSFSALFKTRTPYWMNLTSNRGAGELCATLLDPCPSDPIGQREASGQKALLCQKNTSSKSKILSFYAPKVREERSENLQRKTTSDILNMRNTEQNSKLVKMEYSLETFQRSNQDTCLTHKPSVFEGTWVQSGDLLTDCASSVGGELSLGQNLLIAYMPWEGYNFEDAILISERLVRDDLYTSVHIERYELETLRPPKTSAESKQQTKLGAEEITRNIPDVSEKEIQKLDSYGIIKRGSWVEEGDILVGKVTPINKKNISPYQKLLYTILEKQVKPIKDSSLRAPKGIKAKVVDIKYFLSKNPIRNLTKSTASLAPYAPSVRVRSSKTLVKHPSNMGQKGNKQSFSASLHSATEGKSKNSKKTLVNSSTTRLLGVQKSNVNRQFWKTTFLLYKQRMDHNKKLDFVLLNPLLDGFKKFKKKPLLKKTEACLLAPSVLQKSKIFDKAKLIKTQRVLKERIDRSKPVFKKTRSVFLTKRSFLKGFNKRRNKTYLNFFYKTQTLASLPLLNQRKSLIVLNSFLPFLQRLNKKYKIQKSLDPVNPMGQNPIGLSIQWGSKPIGFDRSNRAKSFLEKEKEQYIIKGTHFVKKSNRGKLPILSLTYASGNKRKGYSKSCPIGFAFGGASLAPSFLASPSEILSIQKAKPCQKASLFERIDRSQQSRARKSEIIQNIETIHIYLAEKRKVQVGDKMAGRHGNKGIVSQILPIQDMPYLPDGTPIDMVLNPLGVPSRMNVGQIYECLLGLAGKYLGENYKIPSFDEAYGADASRSFVFNKLFQARMQTGANWLFDPNSPGKMRLYDGRNGECFLQPVTVGQAYILRLVHMVDDKIHARSTGPYSLVTQQPLRGRSKQGGQRLGEMEVWALEGYGAAFTLLEMLTIKSDDMTGRMTLWSNLILNKDIAIGTPESFKVLVCELQALCLDIGLFRPIGSQPMSHTPSATPQLSVSGGSEAVKQGNGNDFNKFSLREINQWV